MKWDFAIGNPAYQDQTLGDNKGFAPPIYDKFIDAACEIADKVEMIHPARFLFNAGSTPKAWNEKMLNDPHFKVLEYIPKSETVFTNTSIMGGIAITYHDEAKEYGSVGTFTPYVELNSVLKKAQPEQELDSLAGVIYVQTRFDLEALYKKYPQYRKCIGSDGKDRRLRNNIFEKISSFTETKHDENDIKIFGVEKNKRCCRYIEQDLIDQAHDNLERWKVLIPRANGSGAIGEVVPTQLIGTPFVCEPHAGYTQTYIGIGAFATEAEAENALKYVKSKFARTLLGILKITQDNNRETWRMVPLQDFTDKSDINWSTSIANIDKQLYKKYGLSQEEIDFIETHVKEMV